MTKILTASLLLLLTATVAFADIAPGGQERRPNEPKDTILIAVSSNEKEPTLEIPDEIVKRLYAQIGNRDKNAAVISDDANFAKTSTVAGGFLFSLAFLFGGVLLFKNKSSKAAASLILLAILSAGASVVYANVAPPPLTKNMDSSILDPKIKVGWRGFRGNVKVTRSEYSGWVKFSLPQAPNAKTKAEEE